MPPTATVEANPERSKYAALYAAQATGSYSRGYGHSNHGLSAQDLLLSAESVLDVGCGHNELAIHLRGQGVEATGCDFACPAADVLADVLALPFPDKSFEYVTSFDMLEHLLPQQIETAFAEMRRVSHKFIFSISHVDSINRAPGGETLHPTVMPPEDWASVLGKYATFEQTGNGLWIGEWNHA